MSGYLDSERRVDPKHCGSPGVHGQHQWWQMRLGHHICTGNVATPMSAPPDHACVSNWDFTDERGTFCTICNRHILHAEFT